MNNYIVTFDYRVMVTAFAILAMFNTTRFFYLGKDDVFLKVSGGPVGQYLLLYSSSLFLLKF